MKKRGTILLRTGICLLSLFAVWTWLILWVDVQPAGESGTNVGFATLNCRFHQLTGVDMGLYTITDWLGLVPVCVCLVFGFLGLAQMLRRKSLLKVDQDILFLGIYYGLVIFCYLAFEQIPINFRPILIDGRREVSYPSSTTLLVLSVMPTLVYQTRLRIRNRNVNGAILILTSLFSAFMVIGRLISGVHWLTDIVGSLLLSAGLFTLYQAAVLLCRKGNH